MPGAFDCYRPLRAPHAHSGLDLPIRASAEAGSATGPDLRRAEKQTVRVGQVMAGSFKYLHARGTLAMRRRLERVGARLGPSAAGASDAPLTARPLTTHPRSPAARSADL